MKKYFVIMLTFALLFCLSACGEQDPEPSVSDTEVVTSLSMTEATVDNTDASIMISEP